MPGRLTSGLHLDLLKTESAEFYMQASTCTPFNRLQAITCNRRVFLGFFSDDVYRLLANPARCRKNVPRLIARE